MGYRIAKKFSFDAAHHLPHMPPGHKCKRPHGHTYVVEIILKETTGLDQFEFVMDYTDLAPLKAWIDTNLDHQDLNLQFPAMRTTAENLAKLIWKKAFDILKPPAGVMIEAVRVSETPNTWAEYSRL